MGCSGSVEARTTARSETKRKSPVIHGDAQTPSSTDKETAASLMTSARKSPIVWDLGHKPGRARSSIESKKPFGKFEHPSRSTDSFSKLMYSPGTPRSRLDTVITRRSSSSLLYVRNPSFPTNVALERSTSHYMSPSVTGSPSSNLIHGFPNTLRQEIPQFSPSSKASFRSSAMNDDQASAEYRRERVKCYPDQAKWNAIKSDRSKHQVRSVNRRNEKNTSSCS